MITLTRAELQQKVAYAAAEALTIEALIQFARVQTQKDLEHIGDYDLIKSASELGLLTDDEVDTLMDEGF